MDYRDICKEIFLENPELIEQGYDWKEIRDMINVYLEDIEDNMSNPHKPFIKFGNLGVMRLGIKEISKKLNILLGRPGSMDGKNDSKVEEIKDLAINWKKYYEDVILYLDGYNKQKRTKECLTMIRTKLELTNKVLEKIERYDLERSSSTNLEEQRTNSRRNQE